MSTEDVLASPRELSAFSVNMDVDKIGQNQELDENATTTKLMGDELESGKTEPGKAGAGGVNDSKNKKKRAKLDVTSEAAPPSSETKAENHKTPSAGAGVDGKSVKDPKVPPSSGKTGLAEQDFNTYMDIAAAATRETKRDRRSLTTDTSPRTQSVSKLVDQLNDAANKA